MTEWLPAPSVAVLKLAWPAPSATVASEVAPSLKVTLPVGVKLGQLTVALKVTA